MSPLDTESSTFLASKMLFSIIVVLMTVVGLMDSIACGFIFVAVMSFELDATNNMF